MITVSDFNTICATIVSTFGLDGYVLVAQDNHAVKKLKDKQGIQLAATIPSATNSGKPGMPADNHAVYMFIVTKEVAGQTDQEELQQYQTTQQITEKIKNYLLQQQEDGCTDFFRLNTTSISIDPEYNIFGGFLGWSITFTF